ncbi:MAG TPA: arylamine N-acetyltransferase [Gammaproteobacteria bacterium]|nr:arylamine N-acetyltransferase [Gammaproteobacteria bacterium]
MDLDLGAYFKRIGYAGSREPTLDTLRALHRLHPAAIAFENLTTLLGQTPALDLASLEAKMVQGGRGGYCFEHNRLFTSVLEALGFEVTSHGARVLWGAAEARPRPRSHRLMTVRVQGRIYLADVGFGGPSPTAPLRLEPGAVHATPHEPFRLVESDGGFVLEVQFEGAWRPLYSFDLHPQLDVDFEVANYFVATHPASPFPTMLLAARALEDRRVALLNNRLTVYHSDGGVERRGLSTAEALREALSDDFGIVLPVVGELDSVLIRIASGA